MIDSFFEFLYKILPVLHILAGIALLTKGAQRAVAELSTIARCADDRDHLPHEPSLTAEHAESAEKVWFCGLCELCGCFFVMINA